MEVEARDLTKEVGARDSAKEVEAKDLEEAEMAREVEARVAEERDVVEVGMAREVEAWEAGERAQVNLRWQPGLGMVMEGVATAVVTGAARREVAMARVAVAMAWEEKVTATVER
mmetsp:Transcript_23132/g.55772  ORF Transcript_23132/g.55772 Transcript_23132/m.55772 type:complete len:115 (-) Transcript_23132:142-486(-)